MGSLSKNVVINGYFCSPVNVSGCQFTGSNIHWTRNIGNSYHIVRFGVNYFCVVKMIENNVLRVYKKNFAGGALKYCLQTQLYLKLVGLVIVAVEYIISDYSTCRAFGILTPVLGVASDVTHCSTVCVMDMCWRENGTKRLRTILVNIIIYWNINIICALLCIVFAMFRWRFCFVNIY